MSAGAHACELSQPPGESEKVKFAYPLDRFRRVTPNWLPHALRSRT